MRKIEEHLSPSRRSQRRKVVVLRGLGGMGKTQLSIEFARRNQHRFSAVIWLNGRSEGRLKQSITALAGRIPKGQIPESSRVHVPHNLRDRDTVVKDVLDWFSIPENNGWLIVLDNVDQDYRDSQGDPDAYDVRRYLPQADHGSILLTSRVVELEQLGTTIRVHRVTKEQALKIFKNGYRRDFDGTRSPCREVKLLTPSRRH